MKSYILRNFLQFSFPFILIYSFYVYLHGEFSSGGGFQAGALFASLFCILQITPSPKFSKYINYSILAGLIIYILTGLSTLTSSMFDISSHVSLGILSIELGVLIVVGSALYSIYTSFTQCAK